MSAVRLLYVREDGRWAWNLKVTGRNVATDGNQGYENESDARTWPIASMTSGIGRR